MRTRLPQVADLRWRVSFVSELTTYAAIILAAGSGTRMKSQLPKVLHRICGRAMVSLVANAAVQAGLGQIIVVVPPDSQAIRDALGGSFRYVVQPEPLGSGHALLQVRSSLESVNHAVVLSGDVPLIRPQTIEKMIRVHNETKACITLLTSRPRSSDGLGRVVRSESGRIKEIVEEREADEATLSVREVNAGAYCFNSPWLHEALGSLEMSPRGEMLLTDLASIAGQQEMLIESVESTNTDETLGVNTRVHLARAEAALRGTIRERLMAGGVTITHPESVYVDARVEIGEDTIILPNTHITGESRIGAGCEIGPNSVISGSVVGPGCRIVCSVVEESTLEDGVMVGPFSHIRPGSTLQREVYVGNFAEVKNSRLGPGTKSGHFSYVGDADLGANVNIGAGTVTCNYDGQEKHRTTIGDGAFIGSDSMLIAPINIGQRATIGAGAVVNTDVPADSLAIGMPARVTPKRSRRRKKDVQ